MEKNYFRVWEWEMNLGFTAKELLVFAFLCENCPDGYNLNEISSNTGIPTNDVEQCVLHLLDLNYIDMKQEKNEHGEYYVLFAMTLNGLTLARRRAEGII